LDALKFRVLLQIWFNHGLCFAQIHWALQCWPWCKRLFMHFSSFLRRNGRACRQLNYIISICIPCTYCNFLSCMSKQSFGFNDIEKHCSYFCFAITSNLWIIAKISNSECNFGNKNTINSNKFGQKWIADPKDRCL
jgi:hypothetical protein